MLDIISEMNNRRTFLANLIEARAKLPQFDPKPIEDALELLNTKKAKIAYLQSLPFNNGLEYLGFIERGRELRVPPTAPSEGQVVVEAVENLYNGSNDEEVTQAILHNRHIDPDNFDFALKVLVDRLIPEANDPTWFDD